MAVVAVEFFVVLVLASLLVRTGAQQSHRGLLAKPAAGMSVRTAHAHMHLQCAWTADAGG